MQKVRQNEKQRNKRLNNKQKQKTKFSPKIATFKLNVNGLSVLRKKRFLTFIGNEIGTIHHQMGTAEKGLYYFLDSACFLISKPLVLCGE
jgi:hypothetical protein